MCGLQVGMGSQVAAGSCRGGGCELPIACSRSSTRVVGGGSMMMLMLPGGLPGNGVGWLTIDSSLTLWTHAEGVETPHVDMPARTLGSGRKGSAIPIWPEKLLAAMVVESQPAWHSTAFRAAACLCLNRKTSKGCPTRTAAGGIRGQPPFLRCRSGVGFSDRRWQWDSGGELVHPAPRHPHLGGRGAEEAAAARPAAGGLLRRNGKNICLAIRQGTSLDVVEMDAASNNSVDDIRELRENVALAPMGGGTPRLHPRRGAHALERGLERVPEDARGAALARGLRARDHRGAQGAGDDRRPLPPVRLPPARRSSRSRASCGGWRSRRRSRRLTPRSA